jgi:hypothetical protein
MDSNVEVEIINIEKPNNSRAMEYLHFWEIKSFPSAILVSPEGRSLVLPLSGGTPNKSLKESLWSVLESVVSSPKREKIRQNIVKSYCMIVLIQGKDVAENRKAEESVADAMAKIAKMMSQMPKQVKGPPQLILIPRESAPQEKILLWSLGVNEDMSEPHAAVIYGRGRQIGPRLKGEEITESEIFNLLSVIGSACECGLDRGWILGPMLPLRWDKKLQTEVVELLGFDAESPMVKTEISQILSLGRSTGTEDTSIKDELYSYREEAVEFERTPPVATVPLSQLRQTNSTETDSSGAGSIFQVALFSAVGIFLIILAGGLFIILRGRRKA